MLLIKKNSFLNKSHHLTLCLSIPSKKNYTRLLLYGHYKYDLFKIPEQTSTNKFICEAPIVSDKSTKFILLVPTAKNNEKFYTKLSYINREIHIQLFANNNAFKAFHKSVIYEVNIKIFTYITASQC